MGLKYVIINLSLFPFHHKRCTDFQCHDFRLNFSLLPELRLTQFPRFRSRPKLSYDQSMQTEMTSDQTFQTEVTSDQTFQTKIISDQTFQTKMSSDQTEPRPLSRL